MSNSQTLSHLLHRVQYSFSDIWKKTRTGFFVKTPLISLECEKLLKSSHFSARFLKFVLFLFVLRPVPTKLCPQPEMGHRKSTLYHSAINERKPTFNAKAHWLHPKKQNPEKLLKNEALLYTMLKFRIFSIT